MKFSKDSSSTVTVYSRQGSFQARAYHLTCSLCGNQYWQSYTEKKTADQLNHREYYKSAINDRYFMTTRATAFESQYVREIIVDCELGRSFEDVAERFNRLYASSGERGHIHKTRVEDAFFVHTLITHTNDNISVHIDNVSNRPVFDDVCDSVIEDVFKSGSPWLKHKCETAGCSEGFIMCDGNEKLSRRICAAPRQSYKFTKNMPSVVTRCGNSPVFGGAHKKPSKYCENHLHLDSDEPLRKKILLTVNLPDQYVSTRIVDIASDLPSNEYTSMHIACKKAANITHYHDRTAGIMAIVRPCGIVIDWREMYTCESSSQLFVQLLKVMDEEGSNVKFVGYDRACEFAPFLRNLKKKGNVGAEKLLEAEYLVDKFHIKGHTTSSCNPYHPECEFHPSLPKFSEISTVNTECAEQCFSWLKRFKNIVKYMTASRFRFFLHVVIDAHNKNLEKKRSRN